MPEAFQLAEAYTVLTIHDTEFKRVLNSTHGELRKLQAGFDRLGVWARRGFYAATASIGWFLREASEVNKQARVFDRVFGDQAAAARAWGEALAKSVGRSRYEVEAAMAGFQSLFTSLGASRAEADELSRRLTTLAMDLAAFYGISSSEAADKLAGVMRGNERALLDLNVAVTDAEVKQELLNMGVRGGAQAASEHQLALARLAVVARATADAQGEAARQTLSGKNATQQLRASLYDLRVALGQIYAPALAQITSALKDYVAGTDATAAKHKRLILDLTMVGGALLVTFGFLPKVISSLYAMAAALSGLGIGLGVTLGPMLLLAGLGVALAAGFIRSREETIRFGSAMQDAHAGAALLLEDLTGINTALSRYYNLLDTQKDRSAFSEKWDEAVASGDLEKMQAWRDEAVERLSQAKAKLAKARREYETWFLYPFDRMMRGFGVGPGTRESNVTDSALEVKRIENQIGRAGREIEDVKKHPRPAQKKEEPKKPDIARPEWNMPQMPRLGSVGHVQSSRVGQTVGFTELNAFYAQRLAELDQERRQTELMEEQVKVANDQAKKMEEQLNVQKDIADKVSSIGPIKPVWGV